MFVFLLSVRIANNFLLLARQNVKEFGGKVATVEEAHRQEEGPRVVVVALPFRVLQNLDVDSPLHDLLEGKILVDVSNR